MRQLIAIVNVIAWAGFWAFGYLALSAQVENTGQMVIAAVLAAMGGGVGMLAYFWLVRHSEATGYAKPANRAEKRDDDDIHGEVL
ncbi:drug/metabolite transporter (DMT)-like permease [Roseovarius sp. MBR-154]|jgi:drug/metabolite transporter (DMT)-like permease